MDWKGFFIALFWIVVLFVLVYLMSGCTGMPTLVPTPAPIVPTASPAPPVPMVVPTLESVGNVTIIGNVWLRDSVGIRHGYLLSGAQVLAICAGEWCQMGGLRFYRGCASDNPAALECRMEE